MGAELMTAYGAGEIDAADYFAQERLRWAEKVLQKEVLQLAREYGWTLAYHSFFSDRSERGFPDLVLVRPATGQMVIAELKAMKGKLGPRQDEWLAGLATVQDMIAARAIGPHGLYVAVCLWRPCCWNSGEIEDVLR